MIRKWLKRAFTRKYVKDVLGHKHYGCGRCGQETLELGCIKGSMVDLFCKPCWDVKRGEWQQRMERQSSDFVMENKGKTCGYCQENKVSILRYDMEERLFYLCSDCHNNYHPFN